MTTELQLATETLDRVMEEENLTYSETLEYILNRYDSLKRDELENSFKLFAQRKEIAKRRGWSIYKCNGKTYRAFFNNPLNNNRKTPVIARRRYNLDAVEYTFSVSAGANSEFSYSGGFYPVVIESFEHFFSLIEERYNLGNLFK